jgi:nucleoside-diphosphate-sugar epimerase
VGNDIAPILVTGASGYLGGHVLDKIKEKGRLCIAVSRKDCDLIDIGAVRALLDRIRPSVIVHCAALVPKATSACDDIQAAKISVAMVKAVAQTAACPIVFASSMTVYTGVHSFPVHEDIAISPQTGYGQGKWLAEQLLFKRNFKGDVSLRLPGLFGLPRRSGLLYNAAKSFLAEGKFEPDIASHAIWAAIDVQDAAEYMVRAALSALSGHPPQPINVGYEGEFSVLEAVAEIATQCGLTWKPHSQVAQDFSMYLDRLKQRYGLVPATFRQRLAELIEVARNDLLASRAGEHNA